ncbi:hypothetical protein DFJ73DRAFT_324286 [Zopfochytrium polystomum]|nr:hypothetical protein DFJ73DRAFT_324286 [Zopfochytrium polystomum]
MIDALHANSPNHHPMGLLGSAPSTAVAITPPFKCTDIDSAWLHLTATPSSLPESPSTPPLHFLGPHYLAALFLTSGFSQETLSRYFARPVSLDPDSECYLEGRAAWTTVLRALQGALAVLLWGEQPCSAGGDHHHLLAMAVTRKVTVDKAGLVRILAGVGRHRPASKAEEDEASRRDATGGTELGFASDDEEDEMVLGEEDEGRE